MTAQKKEEESRLGAGDFCFALFCFCGITIGALWLYFFLNDGQTNSWKALNAPQTKAASRSAGAPPDLEGFIAALLKPPPPPPPPAPPVAPARTSPALLELPTLLAPANGFVINESYYEENSLVSFSWAEVPGANVYIWTLAREGGFTLNARTLEPSYRIEELPFLPNGAYTWQVEARQEKEGAAVRRGRPAEGSFTVDIAIPQKPQAYEPVIEQ